MSKYYSIYCSVLKSTEKIIKSQSPQLNLNHLKIPKTATDDLIIKSFKQLNKILENPQYYYLIRRD